MKIKCATNENYDNVGDTYWDLLKTYDDLSRIDPMKYISYPYVHRMYKWCFIICESHYSASIYFLSVDLMKRYLSEHQNVQTDDLKLILCACIAEAVKIDKPGSFNDKIFYDLGEILKIKPLKIKSLWKGITKKHNIATTYDYLHFYNEMLWRHQEVPHVKKMYSQMISYMKDTWNINNSSASDIAYSCFIAILKMENITYEGRQYGKEINILSPISSTVYDDKFMIPPRYKGLDQIILSDFVKRKKEKKYIKPGDIISMISEHKKISNVLDLSNAPICGEMNNQNLMDIIGMGIQGLVYKVQGDDSIVIKRYTEDDKDNFNVIRHNQMILIQGEVMNEIIMASELMTTHNENFLYYEGFLICPNYDTCPSGYSAYIMMEKVDKLFSDIFNEPRSYDFVLSILFQEIFTIHILQEKFGGVHNDLHRGNMMFKTISKVDSWLKYDNFYIPNHGYLFKLFDLGFMVMFKKKLILETIYDGKYKASNISSKYLPGYDIAMILYVFIHDLLKYLPENKDEGVAIEAALMSCVQRIMEMLKVEDLMNMTEDELSEMKKQDKISDHMISTIKRINKNNHITLDDFLDLFYMDNGRPILDISRLPLSQLLELPIFDIYKKPRMRPLNIL